jgi:hypothetical protein
MSKIRVVFVKFDRALAMQILQMDERFRTRSNDVEENSYIAAPNFRIVSNRYPSMIRGELSLRGTDISCDFRVDTLSFNNNKQRDEYLKQIIDALKLWAKNWKGFKKENTSPIDVNIGSNIIIEF